MMRKLSYLKVSSGDGRKLWGCQKMAQREKDELEGVTAKVSALTKALLDEGIGPSMIAFALTSVAADMGLQASGDPMRVFPVLLGAISEQARLRFEGSAEEEGEGPACVPLGATVH
ncbi:Hypothetical protein RAK1035_1840 [Roseovarius sp. AK1035]|nr:Hypothetical protein RAK1035_1840 [Roseovarius sp. AK1035]